MKIIKQNFLKAFLITAVFLLPQVNAYAEQGAIKLSNKAFKQVMTKNADGSTEYDYVEPGLVLPNDIIFYELVFENISDKPADNIEIDNPIANNSTYRPNSAKGGSTKITFSVDGKTFAAADALTVRDATGKSWQAKPEEYTVIRWKYTKSLMPGEKGRATYKTIINKN